MGSCINLNTPVHTRPGPAGTRWVSFPHPREPSAGKSLNYNAGNLTGAARLKGPQFPGTEKRRSCRKKPEVFPAWHSARPELQTRGAADLLKGSVLFPEQPRLMPS